MAEIPTSAGVKRCREEPCVCDRAVTCRTVVPRRCTVADAVEKRALERVPPVSSTGFIYCCGRGGHSSSINNKQRTPYTAPLWSSRSCSCMHVPLGVCLTVPQRSGGRHRTSFACVATVRAPSMSSRRVEVDVVRGDTGRRHRFNFGVPFPTQPCDIEKSGAASAAYRDTIVHELLGQLCVEAALSTEHTWVVICHGKNIQSEAGAGALVSSLLSESCQRIPLAVFHGLGVE
ncbi:hypothetical protein DQ04_01101040 [Trypanosoma grayi]|uniref:hypothetical protein n=1 Tax=Trypanosoma grayi TaxID=71804 RepID=UPI0004F4783A|nr:hypothetical protein DQ04_01101040 [Trypanosoma grayi]KEG13283.1 hypothetical protein DQ04_01101040 [Trypanosoma grayi]